MNWDVHVLRYVKGSSRVAAVGVAVISLYGVSCRRLENFNRVLIGKEPARSGRLVLYWGWRGFLVWVSGGAWC